MRSNYENLTAFAGEIERRESAKVDYMVSTDMIKMTEDSDLVLAGLSNDMETVVFPVNDIAQGQLADYLKIPRAYYRRMGEMPGMRTYDVNRWMGKQQEVRLVRTLDGNCRAFLSDMFKPIDHQLIMSALMPALQEHRDLKIVSNVLSDARMYLQIIFQEMEASIVGDVVKWGVCITNSEVGWAKVQVAEFIWKLSCRNGMIGKSLLSRRHIGRRIGEEIEDYNLFSSETLNAEIEAFWLKLRDIIKYTIQESTFIKKVKQMELAAEDKVEKPKRLIENVTNHYNLAEAEGETVLDNMIQERQMNRWGLANGITYLAQQIENNERAYDLERAGNNVIELSPDQWEVLSLKEVKRKEFSS